MGSSAFHRPVARQCGKQSTKWSEGAAISARTILMPEPSRVGSAGRPAAVGATDVGATAWPFDQTNVNG